MERKKEKEKKFKS